MAATGHLQISRCYKGNYKVSLYIENGQWMLPILNQSTITLETPGPDDLGNRWKVGSRLTLSDYTVSASRKDIVISSQTLPTSTLSENLPVADETNPSTTESFLDKQAITCNANARNFVVLLLEAFDRLQSPAEGISVAVFLSLASSSLLDSQHPYADILFNLTAPMLVEKNDHADKQQREPHRPHMPYAVVVHGNRSSIDKPTLNSQVVFKIPYCTAGDCTSRNCGATELYQDQRLCRFKGQFVAITYNYGGQQHSELLDMVREASLFDGHSAVGTLTGTRAIFGLVPDRKAVSSLSKTQAAERPSAPALRDQAHDTSSTSCAIVSCEPGSLPNLKFHVLHIGKSVSSTEFTRYIVIVIVIAGHAGTSVSLFANPCNFACRGRDDCKSDKLTLLANSVANKPQLYPSLPIESKSVSPAATSALSSSEMQTGCKRATNVLLCKFIVETSADGSGAKELLCPLKLPRAAGSKSTENQQQHQEQQHHLRQQQVVESSHKELKKGKKTKHHVASAHALMCSTYFLKIPYIAMASDNSPNPMPSASQSQVDIGNVLQFSPQTISVVINDKQIGIVPVFERVEEKREGNYKSYSTVIIRG